MKDKFNSQSGEPMATISLPLRTVTILMESIAERERLLSDIAKTGVTANIRQAASQDHITTHQAWKSFSESIQDIHSKKPAVGGVVDSATDDKLSEAEMSEIFTYMLACAFKGMTYEKIVSSVYYNMNVKVTMLDTERGAMIKLSKVPNQLRKH